MSTSTDLWFGESIILQENGFVVRLPNAGKWWDHNNRPIAMPHSRLLTIWKTNWLPLRRGLGAVMDRVLSDATRMTVDEWAEHNALTHNWGIHVIVALVHWSFGTVSDQTWLCIRRLECFSGELEIFADLRAHDWIIPGTNESSTKIWGRAYSE